MSIHHSIQLIIGLGNPGVEYEKTRHNAGAWFIEKLAEQNRLTFKNEPKLQGQVAKLAEGNHSCLLFLPTTFMNHSGQAVRAICQFYKIEPQHILVAHDELDLPPGTIRVKFDGGHGGHNGLRDIIAHLHSKSFYRLRLGIGHPGNSKDVVEYVLTRPSQADRQLIMNTIDDALSILPELLSGQIQKAMLKLHTI